MSGKDNSLTPERTVRRQIFPQEVVSAARTHWEHITVTEPALHKRSGPSSATVQVSAVTHLNVFVSTLFLSRMELRQSPPDSRIGLMQSATGTTKTSTRRRWGG